MIDLDFVVFQRVDASRRILQGPEDDAIELRLGAPIVVVPFDHGLHALVAFHELERPRADGMKRDALVAILLDGGRTDHEGLPVALQSLTQPLVVRRGERNLDGHGIDDIDALDPFGIGDHEGFRLLVEVGRTLIPEAIEIELHRGGVEGRAVVELHALAQMKGVRQAVVRDVPGFSEPRHERGRHVVRFGQILFHETFEDLIGDLIGAPAARSMRVERIGFSGHAPDQGASRTRIADSERSRGQQCCRERERQGKSTKNHEPLHVPPTTFVGVFKG